MAEGSTGNPPPFKQAALLTAITFAGLGGFWTLFYSYWTRDKGVGMAHPMGRITGPVTGKRRRFPIPVSFRARKRVSPNFRNGSASWPGTSASAAIC